MTINLNNYSNISISKIEKMTGLKVTCKKHPLCIQKLRLLEEAQRKNLLNLIK